MCPRLLYYYSWMSIKQTISCSASSCSQTRMFRARHIMEALNLGPNSRPCVPSSVSICSTVQDLYKGIVIECEDAPDIPQHADPRGWKGTTSAESVVEQAFFIACVLECMHTVCSQVCVCFHVRRAHLTDEKERARGPPGTNFPSLFPKACSLLRAGGNNTPQPANFICCHFLSFSPSPPETQQCATPTSHCALLRACEAEIGCSGLSKVSKLSLLPRMFSLPLYFSSVMFWERKINQTSWF